jgi:hypothetical protein
MPRILLAPQLRRLTRAEPGMVAGSTVREALEKVFDAHPNLASYVLDDQGRLRKHVALFVDGARVTLDDPVAPNAELCVLRALSGG